VHGGKQKHDNKYIIIQKQICYLLLLLF